MARDMTEFSGSRVLVTGGLGFIGSNLAERLVELGADVTLLDAMIDGHGGNFFNTAPIRDRVKINLSDIREETTLGHLVRDKDFIFHLAGQNDHVLSLTNPYPDIDINIKGTAVLLEACKRHNPNVRLVYTGTRGEYGTAVKLPVDEEQPMNPRGIYELSSLTAQRLFHIYHHNYGVKSITLRLTNIYGERAQMLHHRFGVANWFVRLAIDDQVIPVYGDGAIRRDFLYVADTVDAILQCAACESAYGDVFNVGNNQVSSFGELAREIVRVSGTGRIEFVPFSPERAAAEPGDFCSDITKIGRIVGWTPSTSLADGLARTIAYYRTHQSEYWSSP